MPDDVPEDAGDGASDDGRDPATDAGAAEGPAPTADDASVRDALPDDLDVSGYVGPYTFPNNNRRRVPGYLYLGIGAACALLWLIRHSGGPVLVDRGLLLGGLGLMVMGAYHLVAGWNLDVDEQDALVVATRTVGFAVGHASAQMGWRGLRSRPTWRILVYSAENPPRTRGLVLVDGVDGAVVDWFAEPNPEDWSDLDGQLTGRPTAPD